MGRALLAAALLLFAAQLIRTAWIGDDAFISLRVADNLVNGRGMTWNPGDRVLVVTNPLWTLMLALAYAITGEAFYTALALSAAVSLTAITVLVRYVAISPGAAALGVSLLALSRSFVDYSTSGLENPLTHLLLGGFLTLALRGAGDPARLRWMALLAGLGVMTRPDTLLLYAPPLIAAFFARPGRPSLAALTQGLAPLLLWCVFATFYFGSPVPNSAIAKLDAGVPDLAIQGLRYLQLSAESDPLLAVTLVAGPALALWLRMPGAGPVVAGIALDVVYTVSIGGDFMVGRFFTDAFFCSVALVVALPLAGTRLLVPALVVSALLALSVPVRARLLDGGPWHRLDPQTSRPLPRYGITDERRWYQDRLGFLPSLQGAVPPKAPMARDDAVLGEQRRVVVEAAVGVRAFEHGPSVHVVDLHAITDPLLARMPVLPVDWRPGHAWRVVPPGYLATLRSGRNQLQDPDLFALYDRLDRIHRGPLFDGARFREIARLGMFGTGDAFDRESYRAPARKESLADDLHSESPLSFLMPGVLIRWEERVRARSIRLDLSEQHDFQLTFLQGTRMLATLPSRAPGPAGHALVERRFVVPDAVQASGFDGVLIASDTWYSDQQFQIGSVRIESIREPLRTEQRGER